MTNLRMQKLLYYCHAWHLALKDEPLLNEEFQAWIHGPVIAPLYGSLKAYGSSPIPYTGTRKDDESFQEPPISPTHRAHVMDVLEAYGTLTAWDLERLSHKEQPWLEARGGAAPDAPCKNVIRTETMKSFYRKMLADAQTSGT